MHAKPLTTPNFNITIIGWTVFPTRLWFFSLITRLIHLQSAININGQIVNMQF